MKKPKKTNIQDKYNELRQLVLKQSKTRSDAVEVIYNLIALAVLMAHAYNQDEAASRDMLVSALNHRLACSKVAIDAIKNSQ